MSTHTFLVPKKEWNDHLYWIDDRFFADPEVLKRRVKNESERPAVMNENWVELVLSDASLSGLYDVQVEEYTDFARKFKAVCEDLGVGFTIASFTHAANHPELFKARRKEGGTENIFLLDVENKIDTQWPAETYGANLAAERGLPAGVTGRFRLFTRLTSVSQRSKFASILKVESAELDKPNNPYYIAISPGAGLRVREWLQARQASLDPAHEAIRFYARPWVEDGWPGKWHERVSEVNHNHIRYGQELAEWVGIAVGTVEPDALTEASKCLFVWRDGYWGNWFLVGKSAGEAAAEREQQPSGYKINGRILREFIRRIKMGVTGISEEYDYRLPVCPGLPFLLAMRKFAAAANGEEPEIHWHRLPTEGVVTHRVSIRCSERTWGLRNAFHEKTNDRVGTTKHLLVQLLYACVDGSDALLPEPEDGTKRADWPMLQGLFRGVWDGNVQLHVCAISFTPGWVHLFWTTRS